MGDYLLFFCVTISRKQYWKIKHKPYSFKLVLIVWKYLYLHIYIWMAFAGTRGSINICSIGPSLGTQANPKHRLYSIGNGLGNDIDQGEVQSIYWCTICAYGKRDDCAGVRRSGKMGSWAPRATLAARPRPSPPMPPLEYLGRPGRLRLCLDMCGPGLGLGRASGGLPEPSPSHQE